MSVTVFEWFKQLVSRALGHPVVVESAVREVPKDGISIFLVDKWEDAEPVVDKVINASFSELERASSLVFSDMIGDRFDATRLDTWVCGRIVDPLGPTFVLFQVIDQSVFESPSFKSLAYKLELLNTTVVIVLPAKKAHASLLRLADRIILDVPPRKFRNAERGALYQALFFKKNVTYSQFISAWLRSHKQRQGIVVEHDVIRPWP